MIDFNDLDDGLSGARISAPADIRAAAHVANGGDALFPCPKCSGTGMTRWGKCFACQGKGQRSKRSLAASQGVQTAKANLADRQRAMIASPEGQYVVKRATKGSDFYRSMLGRAHDTYGAFTERQLEMIRADMAKDADRNAAKQAAAPKVDMAAIDALFATAKENGLSKPRFVAGPVSLSLAPATGRNPGAIYVKERGEYAGKIANGVFSASRDASPDVSKLVFELAADPKGTAIRYGRQTGTCCCCGRELTDEGSIEAGIGPVCATKWGF